MRDQPAEVDQRRRPYCPIVNAIAPKAPIGASFTMMPMMRKNICPAASIAWRPLARSPRRTRDAGQDRDQQHLQQVALGEGVEEAGRDDAPGCGRRVVWPRPWRRWRLLAVERRRVGVEAGAGLHDLADEHADQQRERRDHLEVDQRLQADAADLLEVAHRRDAVHDGAEDDRRDHHADQAMKASPSRFMRLAGLGREHAEQHAEDDRDQHLDVQLPIPAVAMRS